MAGSGTGRLPEIDRVKGLAILFVVAIHAKIGEGSLVHEQLVDRAVPIFLFVFGLMSELSFRRARASEHTAVRWYAGRLERLFVPIWAAAALWWLAVLYSGKPPLAVNGWDAALTFAGYSPWIGPSWFVTLLLQLVLVFPLLHRAADRAGPWLALPLAAAVTGYSAWHALDITALGLRLFGSKVPPPGWFYFWIFLPRALWLVVAGMFVARFWGTRPGVRVTLAAALVACAVVPAIALVRPDEWIVGPLRRVVLMHLFDVPVALAMLGLSSIVPLPAPVARPLEWCGRHSFGLYLGHVVVFEVAHMYAKFPEAGPALGRVVYAVLLLASGALLVVAGEWARSTVILPRLRAAR